jgi:hypothetical protein
MIHLDENDQPQLYLIDPHAVRVGPPLDWRASRANLAMLNRWLLVRTSRSDRLRFWHAYHQARTGTALFPRSRAELAREVEQRSWQDNLWFWGRREGRCRSSNRYFRRVRSRTLTGHAVSDLDAGALAALLADPDAPFRRPGVGLLKDSRSSTVVELDLPVGGVMRRLVWKRFRLRYWWEPWVSRLRWPPALRSWVHGHGLRDRSLPTARPLAVLHRRGGGLWWEGYLLTEKITDAIDLHRYLAALSERPPAAGRAALRRCIDRVAHLVRELHARQLSHRDLKAANLLVQEEGGKQEADGSEVPPTFSLWFIDLVGVRRHCRLSVARRIKDLARLNASFNGQPALTRTDRLRFLRVYLQWGLLGREPWKRWWRAIEAATQAKIARNARNGRPLG